MPKVYSMIWEIKQDIVKHLIKGTEHTTNAVCIAGIIPVLREKILCINVLWITLSVSLNSWLTNTPLPVLIGVTYIDNCYCIAHRNIATFTCRLNSLVQIVILKTK